MRKVLLILATTLLTISCNHKQKEQTESPQTKTLTATEIRNQEIQDSLKEPSKYALPFVQLQLNWKMRIMRTEVLRKY